MTGSLPSLELGLVGNGTIGALIDEAACVQWLCLPRLDGEPVFNGLLGGNGCFAVDLDGFVRSEQNYTRNTGVLVTVLHADDGSSVEIADCAPRFSDRGRMFRPAGLVRRIKPLSGAPRITIRLVAQSGYGAQTLSPRRGISHIAFPHPTCGFRVTTDAPISYIAEARAFMLDRTLSFVLGPDESLSDSVGAVARDWTERTTHRWKEWTRRLAIPAEWQEAVIRAAITLKMCVYEETGGIVAALTTSLPEHEGSQRNWDYRYCWLRDAYFTVTALNRLGAVGTLERYLGYLRNTVAHTRGGHIQPVYGIALEEDLTEWIAEDLPGYRGHAPVRIGNQAAEHIQHDVYGHVILGAAQAFFDERLFATAGPREFSQFEMVGDRAWEMHETPDAGIWEYRGRALVHTSSAIMCWAACDRLARITERLKLADRRDLWNERARHIKSVILEKAWNGQIGAFTGAYGGEALDASVLLMGEIGFLPPDDPRFVATVDAVDRDLREGAHVFRYRHADDFGTPKTAFTACTFWHIDALARIGRMDDARDMFEAVLSRRTKLGLLSEDIDTSTGELWGNFPQTYSMVGIINVAGRLSRRWDEMI